MRPAITITATAFLILWAVVCQSANSRYETWQTGRPYTLSAWTTHEAAGGDTLDLDYFRGSGLNTAFEGRCAYNAERPTPGLGGIPCIYFVYGNKLPDLDGFIADLDKARKTHNIVALILGDEVASSHGDAGLTHYGQISDWVVSNPDPEIRSLITLTCVPGGDLVSGSAHMRDYYTTTVQRIKPDVILPQFYPQLVKDAAGGAMSGSYFSSMEWWSNWTRDNNVAFWACNRAWTSGLPLPSESSLRLQRFAGLAYGVRGMVDFLWVAGVNPTIQDAGYWHPGGPNPTVMYTHLAPINRELSNLGPAMLQLTPVGVYHMDSRDDGDGVRHWSDSDANLPPHLRRTWKLANVTGPVNRNHLMVGLFRDSAGEEYFMVVNKDAEVDKTGKELSTPVVLTFHPSVKGLQRLNRVTGKVENIRAKEHYTFLLPGGTGDLFKFDTGSPFAGIGRVVAPRLIESDPASGGTCCKLFANTITFKFDRNAGEVMAQIRLLDDDGKETGDDLSERFDRILVDDRTLTYLEKGSVLANKKRYAIKLHWADSKPVKVYVLRGDVDGDGKITPADKDAALKLHGQKGESHRADLNSDGVVDDIDIAYLDRIVSAPRFEWSEDFESYLVGPLSGNGRWVEPETIPGTVLSKAWVNGPVLVTDGGTPLGGSKRVCGKLAFHGSEIRFHDGGGFDSVGVLRVAFTTRVGRGEGYQNTGLHVWNSGDKESLFGNFTVEQQRGTILLAAGRGVRLGEGTKSVTVEGGQGPESKGVRVEFVVDFETSKLTWQCEDLDHSKFYGPFEVAYTGTVKGLDGMSIIADTPDAQLDDISVRNY